MEQNALFDTLYFPEKKLLLHPVPLSAPKPSPEAFLALTRLAATRGLSCVHLWEDRWLYRREVVTARLLARLGGFRRVSARLCTVQRIDAPTYGDLLQLHHLNGATSSKFKYGLFLKNMVQNREVMQQSGLLVAVAGFAGGRTFREPAGWRSHELVRFASVGGTVVAGGLGKLLRAFVREHAPDDVMTYADRDWSDGRGYQQLGFELAGQTPPQFFSLDAAGDRVPSVAETPLFNTGNLKYVCRFS